MLQRLFPRALVAALLLAALIAAPARAAATSITVDEPRVVDGVRYAGAHAVWFGTVAHEPGQRPFAVRYWITNLDRAWEPVAGSEAAPLTGELGDPEDPAGATTFVLEPEGANIANHGRYRLHVAAGGITGTFDFTGDTAGPDGFSLWTPRDGTDTTPLFSGAARFVAPREDADVSGIVQEGDASPAVDPAIAMFSAPIVGERWSTSELVDADGDLVELTPGTYRTEVWHCDSAQACSSASLHFRVLEPEPLPAPSTQPAPPAAPGLRPVALVPSRISGLLPVRPVRRPTRRTSPFAATRDTVAALAGAARTTLGTRLGALRRAHRLAFPVAVLGTPVRVCVFAGGAATADACLDDDDRHVIARGETTPRAPGTATLTLRPTKNLRSRLSGRRRARVRILAVQTPRLLVRRAVAGRSVTLRR